MQEHTFITAQSKTIKPASNNAPNNPRLNCHFQIIHLCSFKRCTCCVQTMHMLCSNNTHTHLKICRCTNNSFYLVLIYVFHRPFNNPSTPTINSPSFKLFHGLQPATMENKMQRQFNQHVVHRNRRRCTTNHLIIYCCPSPTHLPIINNR